MIKHKDESIFIDFEYVEGEIPDGYRAVCYIRDREIIKSYELSRSDDNKSFLLRINSGELNTLKGTYKLEVAIVNEDLGYKDYIFNENLIVKA